MTGPFIDLTVSVGDSNDSDIDLTLGPGQIIDLEVSVPSAPGPPGESIDVSNFVTLDDVRLTDSRTPLSHTHEPTDVVGLTALINSAVSIGDANTLAEAKTYADNIDVNLSALVDLAEESSDIADLTSAIQDLANTPPEVTQAELDASAAQTRNQAVALAVAF